MVAARDFSRAAYQWRIERHGRASDDLDETRYAENAGQVLRGDTRAMHVLIGISAGFCGEYRECRECREFYSRYAEGKL